MAVREQCDSAGRHHEERHSWWSLAPAPARALARISDAVSGSTRRSEAAAILSRPSLIVRGSTCGTRRGETARCLRRVSRMTDSRWSGLDVHLSFDELYYASHRPVLRAVLMLVDDVETASDITAEAFTRALSRWDQISQLENPGGWVRHVAINLAIDHTRTARRRTIALRHLMTGLRRSSPPPTGDSVDLVRALHRLSPVQRQAIVLHHLLDMSVADIAEHTKRPVGSVKTNLARGRAALAQTLRTDTEVPADV